MKNQSLAARKAALEAKISGWIGTAVELTFRDERNVTISSEGNALAAFNAVGSDRFNLCQFEAGYDAECDMTFAYIQLPTLTEVQSFLRSL